MNNNRIRFRLQSQQVLDFRATEYEIGPPQKAEAGWSNSTGWHLAQAALASGLVFA